MEEIHQIDKTNLGILWQRIRTYVLALLTVKADRSTTLAGYGITDAYTKSSIDSLLEAIELTPGPQGEQGEQGEQGAKGDTGEAGTDGANGIGLKGEIDVVFTTERKEGTSTNYVKSISNIDDVTTPGLYVLHEGIKADSILSVERLTDSYVMQYVMVGGYVGLNTQKFITRSCVSGTWTDWEKYDIYPDKQRSLSCSENFTMHIGDTILEMTEEKLIKLKTLVES